jgi:uncharacterized cofD-like protein
VTNGRGPSRPGSAHGGPLRVVAFGGGHGLSASLRALKRLRSELPLELTAVVTVGDDGGSSGRLRRDRGGLPPGDLRQALTALADPGDETAQLSVDLWQFRFDGSDPLAGHAVGNLLLTGLMELTDNPVLALDRAGGLLRAVGRVLPMSPSPLSIEATVRGDDPIYPNALTTVRGQHAVAVTGGEVLDVRLDPPEPVACAEAIEAVSSADWLVFGPGSWFTSVIPHLLVPDLAAAIVSSRARRLVTLNLAVERETAGLSLPDHLRALARYLPSLRVDVVLADGKAVGDPMGLQVAAESLGARVVLAPVCVADGSPRHDPAALADALYEVLGVSDPPSSEHRSERASEERSEGGARMTDPPTADRVRAPADVAVAPQDGPPGPDSNAR